LVRLLKLLKKSWPIKLKRLKVKIVLLRNTKKRQIHLILELKR
jgi:5-methylthioribose kinase